MAKAPKVNICRNCHAAIPFGSKICPQCGAKIKKPFYKRWWFILLVVLFVLGIIGSMGESDSVKDTASISITEDVTEDTSEDTIGDEPQTPVPAESEQAQSVAAATPTAVLTEAPTAEPVAEATAEPAAELIDGMRPEIKEAIDSYEAFFDEYCDFMKTYSESESTVELLASYASYTAQYADTMAKMEELENSDLNDAETLYYAQVSARVTQKLLEVAQTVQ